MSERRDNKKYTFTVEGQTEQWYFEWLKRKINECDDSRYTVIINVAVQQAPLAFAKRVNPIAVPCAVHICDYESKEPVHVQKFQGVLDQLSKSNKMHGRSFKYQLGYSNLTFELWMVLHKLDCNGSLTNRTQYLESVNKTFHERFKNLGEYKREKNFKRCLDKLTLEDVKSAIRRSKQIMDANQKNGTSVQSYKGFKYYEENPSLTIWKSVEKILKDCNLS